MLKRWDYKICPNCGAALDPGEKCDCEIKSSAEAQGLKIEQGYDDLLEEDVYKILDSKSGRLIGMANDKTLLSRYLEERRATA